MENTVVLFMEKNNKVYWNNNKSHDYEEPRCALCYAELLQSIALNDEDIFHLSVSCSS